MHGGSRNNCGYRDLNCTIGASKSAHKDGMAADLISVKMSAADMRKKIFSRGLLNFSTNEMILILREEHLEVKVM